MINGYAFRVGDYVIADHADFDDFTGDTFKIIDFTTNALGLPLVRVVNIRRPNGRPTSFYPRELSFEDGSSPTTDAGEHYVSHPRVWPNYIDNP